MDSTIQKHSSTVYREGNVDWTISILDFSYWSETCNKGQKKSVSECPSTPRFTDLSVAVLASFGGGHLDNLAGSTFQHHKAIFAQGRALHGVGSGCPSITRLEVQLCICHACCGGQQTENKICIIWTWKPRVIWHLDISIRILGLGIIGNLSVLEPTQSVSFYMTHANHFSLKKRSQFLERFE